MPEFLVTIIDACHNPVKVAPFTPSSAIGMGIIATQYANNSLAVILKHHGVITFGKDIEEALFAAVYLEESAKTLCSGTVDGLCHSADRTRFDSHGKKRLDVVMGSQ